jgi:hypothetical protein
MGGYGDDRNHDGHSGEYDEDFMRRSTERLGKHPQPFCPVIFTISSHDPLK